MGATTPYFRSYSETERIAADSTARLRSRQLGDLAGELQSRSGVSKIAFGRGSARDDGAEVRKLRPETERFTREVSVGRNRGVRPPNLLGPFRRPMDAGVDVYDGDGRSLAEDLHRLTLLFPAAGRVRADGDNSARLRPRPHDDRKLAVRLARVGGQIGELAEEEPRQ